MGIIYQLALQLVMMVMMIIKNIKYNIKSTMRYLRIKIMVLKLKLLNIIRFFKLYFIKFFTSLKSTKTLLFFALWCYFYTSNWLSKVLSILIPSIKIPFVIAVPLYFFIFRLMFFILSDITKYIDHKIKRIYFNRFGLKKIDIKDIKDINTRLGIYTLRFYSLRPYIIKDMLKLGLNLEKYNLLLDELNLRKKELEDSSILNSSSKYYEAIYNISLEKESLMNRYNKLKKKEVSKI